MKRMGSAQWICPGLGCEYLPLRDLGDLSWEEALRLLSDGLAHLRRWQIQVWNMIISQPLRWSWIFRSIPCPFFPHLLKKGKGDVLLFRVRLERSLSIFFLIPGCPEDAGSGPIPRTIEGGPAMGMRCLTGQPGAH